MADSMTFDLVSPEKELAQGSATMVVAPGVEGDFGAMPGHAPFLTTLRPGVVTAEMTDGSQRFVVFGGFAEIGPDRVTILADDAMMLADLDAAAVDARIEAVEKAPETSDAEEAYRRVQYLSDLRALKQLHTG